MKTRYGYALGLLAAGLSLLGGNSTGLGAQERPVHVVRGRVLDGAGVALPAGEVVQGRVELHYRRFDQRPEVLKNFGFWFEPIEIGEDGTFAVPTEFGRVLEGYSTWLHLERELEGGGRERVFVPAQAQVGTVAFEREVLLARVRAADDLGAEVLDHAYTLELKVADPVGPPASVRLSARWVRKGELRELWGYRPAGEYSLLARYHSTQLYATEVALALDGADITVVLPATGVLLVRLEVPRPFPERSVYAVIEDLERGILHRRSPIPNDSTNLRLQTGPHRLHFELYGVRVSEPVDVEVPHATTHRPAPLDLRERARVFAIEVVSPNGIPIPTARVRVAGSPDQPSARQRALGPDGYRSWILVATLGGPIDVEVFELNSEFTPVALTGVDADRVVVLEPVVR